MYGDPYGMDTWSRVQRRRAARSMVRMWMFWVAAVLIMAAICYVWPSEADGFAMTCPTAAAPMFETACAFTWIAVGACVGLLFAALLSYPRKSAHCPFCWGRDSDPANPCPLCNNAKRITLENQRFFHGIMRRGFAVQFIPIKDGRIQLQRLHPHSPCPAVDSEGGEL